MMHLYIIAQLPVVFGVEALMKKTLRMLIRWCIYMWFINIGTKIAKVCETCNSGLAKYKLFLD